MAWHAQATRGQIDAIWRIESARVIASVARLVRDVGVAEDLAQDAVVIALERWPSTGVPPNPGAWLTATAKHRAIDLMRRSTALQDKYAQIARDLGVSSEEPDLDAELDDDIGDDLLSLMFTCCHPILSTSARVALTLRMLGGLRTPEIARAFLVPDATVGQRIAARHAQAQTPDATDWVRIAALYEVLAGVANSPVVELNRAVAVGMAFGPEMGLQSVDALVAGGALDGYHLLPSVRGDLLAKLGRWAEARAEFERAASMTQNGRERELLVARAAECAANA